MSSPIEWNAAGTSAIVSVAGKPTFTPAVHDVATNVYEIDPLCDPRWADLVESHPRASVFHSTNWLRALQAVYEYEPVAITTCHPELPLTNGLVFCRVKSWLTGRRLVSLPFSDHCDPLINSPDELDEILLGMEQYVDEGWRYIETRPGSWQPSSRTKLSKSLTYRLHLLDLRRSKEELFRSFHKDCVQRKIRRAQREKLRYEQGSSEVLLREFYRLFVMTRRRQGQPIAWFRTLVAIFGSKLKISVTYKDELPTASIITLSHKRSVVYKYGCSDARFHRLGGMALLLWNAIQEARDNGFDEFDMGRSDTDNLGLIAFKERWGATSRELSYWTYPRSAHVKTAAWQKKFLRSVAAVIPDMALTTVGTLFYRHIG
jgi:CelD/BcsL family acetyltransferase involved in cellulose biosynthesis